MKEVVFDRSDYYIISLLDADDYDKLPDTMKSIGGAWWLRTPGKAKDLIAFVDGFGAINKTGTLVNAVAGVRPILRSVKLAYDVGEQVRVFGVKWTVIMPGVAVANDVIDMVSFDGYSNDWSESTLRIWLENWANAKNGGSQPKLECDVVDVILARINTEIEDAPYSLTCERSLGLQRAREIIEKVKADEDARVCHYRAH